MYSFAWLCQSMRDRKTVTIMSAGSGAVYSGLINGITAESGSGKNWIISLAVGGGGYRTIFVKAE